MFCFCQRVNSIMETYVIPQEFWPLNSLNETLVMLPSFLSLGKVQTADFVFLLDFVFLCRDSA